MQSIVQIVKKLNNTELGKGRTHDTYVLIPNNLDITDVFEPETEMEFSERCTGKKIKVRNTVGREKRIVGLGQYYREQELCAGDEIVFEKRILNEAEGYYIYSRKYSDNLVIQKSKNGFEILTKDRLDKFLNIARMKSADIRIEFLKSERKRNDSPDETDFYEVIISGESLMSKLLGKSILELTISGNEVVVSEFYGWKKYIFKEEG